MPTADPSTEAAPIQTRVPSAAQRTEVEDLQLRLEVGGGYRKLVDQADTLLGDIHATAGDYDLVLAQLRKASRPAGGRPGRAVTHH
jgi:hypothetical protein